MYWTGSGWPTVAQVALQVQDADGLSRSVTLRRDIGEPWGVEFAEALFDGVRTCQESLRLLLHGAASNRHAKGALPARRRLSAVVSAGQLHLPHEPVRRRCQPHRRATPVSALRVAACRLTRSQDCAGVRRRTIRALERFDELIEGGIDLHVQIVLVPGVNDGARLEESLTWLAEREGVASVGIVPLGYTRFQSQFTCSYGSKDAAEAVVRQVEPWQEASQRRDGVSWVYLADELYLSAMMNLPPADEYDGFPQYENGIGIARSFIDEFAASRRSVEGAGGDAGPRGVLGGPGDRVAACTDPARCCGRIGAD